MLHQIQPRSSCPVCRAVFRRQLSCCPLDGARVVPLPNDPLIGKRIGRHYEIVRVDGDTRTRRIYRALDTTQNEVVTVQVLFGDLVSARDARERFAREARICARLSHPYVLQVLDYGTSSGGLPYMVTPFVETRSLEALMRQEGRFAPPRARRIARELAAALAHVHAADILHLNVKPTVIGIRRTDSGDEHVVLAGFYRALESQREGSPSGRVRLGSAPYVAPEVVGGKPDPRSDLFSLGVILYRMLCGETPFSGSPLQVAVSNHAEPIPAIGDRVPGLTIDGELEAIALKLAARRPADRFNDAGECHRALGA